MSRELNRDIFGEFTPPSLSTPAKNDAWSKETLPPRQEPAKVEDARLVGHHVETLKRRMKDYEYKLDALNSKMTELMSATKARIERIAAATHRAEEFSKMGFQELNSKFASISGRVSERRVHDTKVEEMVDRHAQVLNQFEVRLNQLQKIIGEQEMQLMNSRSALQEALREIARLKKL
jgi:hypothetical protein